MLRLGFIARDYFYETGWRLGWMVAGSKDNPTGKSDHGKKETEMKTIEISCVEVWREISNYLDEEISAEKRERMEAHFKICGHCTAVLDATRNVVGLVGDGNLFQMPDGFSKRLHIKLQKRP